MARTDQVMSSADSERRHGQMTVSSAAAHRRSLSVRVVFLPSLAVLITLPLGVLSAVHRGDGSVSLAQLSANQEAYSGKYVQTHGVVREFEGGYVGVHYVIEDSQSNRVLIQPADKVAPYLGRDVTVFGQFEWHAEGGRFINADRIQPAS
jgi:hypothetical protein